MTTPTIAPDAGSARRSGHGRRTALMSGVSLLVLALGGLPGPASAGTETFSGPWSALTATDLPAGPYVADTVQTSFTGYRHGSFNYALFGFTVTASGIYTARSTTTPVQNATYFLTGLFSPGASPATPISNFFAGIYSGWGSPYTDHFNSLSLTSGTQYSLLIVFDNTGSYATDRFTFSMTGPGCMDVPSVTTCSSNILASHTYLSSGLGSSVNPVLQGGTLQVDVAGATYNQSFTLDGSGTNTIDQDGKSATYSGVFSDAVVGTSGGITIANSGSGGSITFAGANTYTGSTTINSGATLALSGAGSIATSSGLTDNGTFDISATTSGASVARLGGSGVVSLGAHTLTVTAANDTFSGVITGTGGLTISAGTESLTGANTYTGMTTVASGAELDLLGSLASPVSVGNGATLRGLGHIGGAVSVGSGGTLAIGASPAQVTVSAPVTLAAGSTLSFDIDGATPGSGAGHYSTLTITGSGNALTAGGTLDPVLRGITGSATNTYTPALGQQFMVVSAQGGVLGSFSGLTQPSSALLPGTRVDALYAPSSLSLVVTPASYGNLSVLGLAETANEAAVGRALDAIRPTAGVRMFSGAAGLFGPLYALSGPAIPPALNQFAPTIYGDGLMAARQTWYAMADAVTDQIAARRSGITVGQTLVGPHGSTIWASGIGQFSHVNSADAPGYHTSLGGAIAGIDIPLTPDAMVGAAAGGGSTDTSSNGATDTGTSVQFSLYGGVQSGLLFLDGQAAYTHGDQAVRRSLALSSTAATSNGTLNGGGAQVQGGLRLAYGPWQIEPAVGVSVLSLVADGVSEDVGGSPAEQIHAQSITSAQSLVSLRFGSRFAITPTVPIAVHALVGWEHEYADVLARSTTGFSFAAANLFSVSSAPIARDAARLGAGFDVSVTPAVSLFGAYQAELGRASTAQNLTGGIRVIW